MHTRQLMYKLQKALKQNNIIISISTIQFYSESQDRMIDYYIVKQGKNKVLIESASQIQIVRYLADLLEEVRNDNESGNRQREKSKETSK